MEKIITIEQNKLLNFNYDNCTIDYGTFVDMDMSVDSIEELIDIIHKKFLPEDKILKFILVFKYLSVSNSAILEIHRLDNRYNFKLRTKGVIFEESSGELIKFLIDNSENDVKIYVENEKICLECTV